jgi:putative phosphoesterase
MTKKAPASPASEPLSIGVIADTHGVLSPAIAPLFAGVTHIIHAGDVGRRLVLRRLEEIAPVTAVSGNADTGMLAASLPSRARGEVDGVRFLVVHKPKAIKRLLPAAREEGVRLIVTGHLHEPGFRWEDGILHLNPGTATAPEEGDSQATVAIVTILADGLAVSFIPIPRPPATPSKSRAKARSAKSSGSGTRAGGDGARAREGTGGEIKPDGHATRASADLVQSAGPGLPVGEPASV